jgi:hypothetical protein
MVAFRNHKQADCDVFLDGNLVGVRKEGYRLPPGAHHVRIHDRVSGEDKSHIFHFKAGSPETMSF